MTLTNISLLSFKTPLLGLVLMTAYAAVSVYPTSPRSLVYQATKATIGPLFILGFSVVVTLISSINTTSSVNIELLMGCIARVPIARRDVLGLMEITHTPRMPSRSGPPLPWTTISETVKAKH